MQAAEEALNKMDYEGLVGGMKTRFKYKSVTPTSFGLSTEEILLANDKELGQYVSVKKLAAYREKDWIVSGKQRNQFRRNLKQRQRLTAESQNRTSSTTVLVPGKRKRKSREEMQFGEDGEAVGNQLEDLDRRMEMEARGEEEVVEEQVQYAAGAKKKKRVRKKQAARLAKQQDAGTPAARASVQAEAGGEAERKARKKKEKRERRKLRKLGEAAAAAAAAAPAAAPAPVAVTAADQAPAVADADAMDQSLASEVGSHKRQKKQKINKDSAHKPREVHKIGGVSVNRLASYGTDIVKKARKQAKRRRKAK